MSAPGGGPGGFVPDEADVPTGEIPVVVVDEGELALSRRGR